MSASLLSLPPEILDNLLAKCEIHALGRLCLTCKHFQEHIDGGISWREKWKELAVAKSFTTNTSNIKNDEFKSILRRHFVIQAIYYHGTSDYPRKLLSLQRSGSTSKEDILSIELGSKYSWMKRTLGNWSCTECTRTPIRPQLSKNNDYFDHPSLRQSSEYRNPTFSYGSDSMARKVHLLTGDLPKNEVWIGDAFFPGDALLCTCIVCCRRVRVIGGECRGDSLSLFDPQTCVHYYQKHGPDGKEQCLSEYDPIESIRKGVSHQFRNKEVDKQSSAVGNSGDGMDRITTSSKLSCHASDARQCLRETTDHTIMSSIPDLRDISEVSKRLVRKSGISLDYKEALCHICEPKLSGPSELADLVQAVFEELGFLKLALVPKPVSLALSLGLDTCLVVDSGAHSTLVATVVNSRLLAGTEQVRGVGGAHISHTLAETLGNKGFKVCACDLDGRDVKCHCFLKINPQLPTSVKEQQLTLPSVRHSSGWCEVTLKEELHLAAELMYSTLNLPVMVQQSVSHLPHKLQKSLLSKIVLAGGNCALSDLNNRLQLDLQRLMPEHAQCIWVRNRNFNLQGNGNEGVEGLSYLTSRVPEGAEGNSMSFYHEDMYVSREEYIVFGKKWCLDQLQKHWRIELEEVKL